MKTIDPWTSATIEYSKLFEDFGLSPFEPLLNGIPDPHRYMRRGIIFGHRDYDRLLGAMLKKKPFAVMSGFMPSGKVHLGGKMVMDEIIWHQKAGGKAFVCIADREAHSVRGISWERCKKIGVEEYILSLIALGFEPDGYIYFQSKEETIKDLAFELGIYVNFTELSAVYGLSGETNISHLISVLTQCADILMPQLEKFGGPKPVVIPVGADQDPHIRLVRDIADRVRMFRVERRESHISVRAKRANKKALEAIENRVGGEIKMYKEHLDIYGENDIERIEEIVREVELEFGGYGFFLPSSTCHRFMSGLTGGKMSSSIPESYISLTESPESAAEKVKKAITGGRVTSAEQRSLGGEPDKCTVYELLLYHLIEDDEHVKEIFEECVSGKRLCGSCKKAASELMRDFLREHQNERENARGRLKEYGI
ncbi:MAG: tryptophan--tRNA ligase [Candidatus Syntropharchaeia archaeon]